MVPYQQVYGVLQWFRLFFNGVMSEGRYAGVRTPFNSGSPNLAQIKLYWIYTEDTPIMQYEYELCRVMNGLRKEAVRLAASPSKDIDIPHHVYGWLVDVKVPAMREDLLFEAKQKVCSMIGPKLKMLGFRAYQRKHSLQYLRYVLRQAPIFVIFANFHLSSIYYMQKGVNRPLTMKSSKVRRRSRAVKCAQPIVTTVTHVGVAPSPSIESEASITTMAFIKWTAPNFSGGDPEARLSCPLSSCTHRFSSDDTLINLWEHYASPNHAADLYAQNHNPCEFGCAMGLPDTMSGLDQCSMLACTVSEMSTTRCSGPKCNFVSRSTRRDATDISIRAYFLPLRSQTRRDCLA
jgi:hypothetical protein